MADNILREITAVSKTDMGMVRSENQDSFGVFEGENCSFYFVADGMGGARGGATASTVTVETILAELKGNDKAYTDRLVKIVKLANSKVFEEGSNNRELYGMGTTLVGLCFVGQKMIVVNVGDSRAYRIREQHIKQLTTDHTLVGELVRSGAISEDQVENHPVSHMLTRSLGPSEKIDVDCGFGDNPQAGDQYLICSDGLYNYVQDYEIAKVVNENTPEEAVNTLVTLANSRMCNDNVTVILITISSKYSGIVNKKKEAINVTDTVKLGEEQAQIAVIPKSSYYLLWGSLFVLLFIVIALLTNKTPVKEIAKAKQNSVHEDSFPQTNSNDELINRKMELTQRLERLTSTYELFDKSKEGLSSYFAELKDKQSELEKKVAEVSSQIEFLTNKLSVWVGRKKRFTPQNSINMAAEIASFSERVSAVKRQRDEISHQYLNTREDLSYQPHNDGLKEKKDKLAEQLKNYSDVVANTVREVIEEKITEAERDLIQQSDERSGLRQAALQLEQDSELLKVILTGNEAEISAKKLEMTNKIREIKTEIVELEDIMTSNNK